MPRKEMPSRRETITQDFRVGKRKIFFSLGLYENGEFGELFITVSKTGADERAYLDCLARAVSLGLQSGVEVGTFISLFDGVICNPNGLVLGHEEIKFCKSPIDLLSKWLRCILKEREGMYAGTGEGVSRSDESDGRVIAQDNDVEGEGEGEEEGKGDD